MSNELCKVLWINVYELKEVPLKQQNGFYGFLMSPSDLMSADEIFIYNAASHLVSCQKAPPCVQSHLNEGYKMPP